MHVTLLALPHCLPSSLTLPLEMLAAADGAARRQGRRPRQLEVCVAAAPGWINGTRVPTLGMGLQPDCSWEAVAQTGLLIVPALWRNPLNTLRGLSPLHSWLRRLAADGTLLCAVGSGSFLLAAAGLLDDRPATTHWFYFDLFARRYPKVALKRQHLITEAGNLFCAGSVNSVADLTIHFIEHFFGNAVARHVEAQFSPEIRRPFEQHVYVQGHDNRHGDELVIQAQEQLRARLAGGVSIAGLARQLGVSQRTLDRRFQRATGLSPGQYLLNERLNSARELLRTTNLGIAEIALQVGYTDAGHFGRRFREAMGQTPGAYRQAVRGKLFSVQGESSQGTLREQRPL